MADVSDLDNASIPAAVVALRRGEGTGVQLGIGDRVQEECDLLLRRVSSSQLRRKTFPPSISSWGKPH